MSANTKATCKIKSEYTCTLNIQCRMWDEASQIDEHWMEFEGGWNETCRHLIYNV